jgi:hypothetical protein
MSPDEPLLEVEVEERQAEGCEAIVQLLWGNQRCRVVEHFTRDSYPVTRVLLLPVVGSHWSLADTIVVSSARVRPL